MLKTTKRLTAKTPNPQSATPSRPLEPEAAEIARGQTSYGNQAMLRSLGQAGVRLHVDSPRASQLDAAAVTAGDDIHFASGLSTETVEGRETLGHELAHVLQQRAGRVRPTAVMNGVLLNDRPELETEADAFGRRFVENRGDVVIPPGRAAATTTLPVQRQTKGKRKKKSKPPAKEDEPKKAAPPSGGTVAEGDPLTEAEIKAVREALKTAKNKRYIVYKDVIKVGGTLAWRANNPGNLRGAKTQIARVKGAVGYFAVFATLEDGEAAQRALYLDTYGDMTVRAAVAKLTPKSENDLDSYLKQLTGQGIDLDGKVKDQIESLMAAIKVNEGSGTGTEISRATE